MTKACSYCDVSIEVKPCRVRPRNFCSIAHNNYFYRGRPAWNKGTAKVSTENELVRKSNRYKEWRKAVFERDDYTCQECGEWGGRLNADHIKPFAYFPELRFDINNGRPLCEPCHRKTPTYGWGAMHTYGH